MNQALDTRLARTHDVLLTELFALLALCEGHPTGTRMQDLADRLGLEQSSVSRLTTRLQRKGLIERVKDDHDRRGVYCVATPAGQELATTARLTLAEALGELLDVAAFDEHTAAVVARLRYSGRPADRPMATSEETS
ncbi:MarR family winged helix-turn-helix transcriptional regulator [Actinosynnema sp. ALI-1.44]|uniref:MarR family winged helix-turn-helix transcriptional regulator n=1 Tax=Actinosynnema sp. ALI-1.44 TaxID=1933779 RepID=UPI00192CECB0|nr:MarR family transcriptional regulator [Actinosynnema sp. ALI-1.44]